MTAAGSMANMNDAATDLSTIYSTVIAAYTITSVFYFNLDHTLLQVPNRTLCNKILKNARSYSM